MKPGGKYGLWIVRRPGLLTVIEGIDGAGKSTLLGLLKPLVKAVFLAEPSQGQAGLLIRQHLKAGRQLSQVEWLRLFTDDRRSDLAHNILPALEHGHDVVLDRYYYSTAAYQGQNQDGLLSAERILRDQESIFRRPDLLIFLSIAPERALERVASRPGRETFETNAELVRIAANYERILPPQTVRLNAEESPHALAAAVAEIILDRQTRASL